MRLYTTPALLTALLLTAFPLRAEPPDPGLLTDEAAQREFVQDKIREHFPESYPVMLAIAYCETRARPFIHWEADGSLRPNASGASSAGGTFQVLLNLHSPDIEARGLDMYDIDDYMEFVAYLHGRFADPYQDWNESRSCWEPRIASR